MDKNPTFNDAFYFRALQAKLKKPLRNAYEGHGYKEEILPALRVDKRFLEFNKLSDIKLASMVFSTLSGNQQKAVITDIEQKVEEQKEDKHEEPTRPKLHLSSNTPVPTEENNTNTNTIPQVPYAAKNIAKTGVSNLSIFASRWLSRGVGAIEEKIYGPAINQQPDDTAEQSSMPSGGGEDSPASAGNSSSGGGGSSRKGSSYGSGRPDFGSNNGHPRSPISSSKTPFSNSGFNFFKGRALIIFFVILFVVLLLAMISGSLSSTNQDLSAPGVINTCEFTRSDQTPKEASFKSPQLMQYIEEASRLSSIPSVIFAAFIRVESPSSVNLTDESLKNYQCAISSTGASGIMQIQPQGTTGHAADAVANGARLAGLDYNLLTQSDYCDVRKNIIIGAGFILKKMSYLGFGDGTTWEEEWTNNKDAIYALAQSYYGCLNYGDRNNPNRCAGPYNYGEDVWTSMQRCKQGALTTSAGFSSLSGFAYYCQGDPRWDNKSSCGIGQIGCGPTSLAMVFTSFGKTITPPQMYQVFAGMGRINCSAGSYMETILNDRTWMASQGFEVGPNITANSNLDLNKAKKYLGGDYLIVGSSQTFPSYKTPGATFPHIFVIDGVDITNKTFSNRDPANCDYNSGAEVTSRVVRPANGAGGLNWAYAYPIKRIK